MSQQNLSQQISLEHIVDRLNSVEIKALLWCHPNQLKKGAPLAATQQREFAPLIPLPESLREQYHYSQIVEVSNPMPQSLAYLNNSSRNWQEIKELPSLLILDTKTLKSLIDFCSRLPAKNALKQSFQKTLFMETEKPQIACAFLFPLFASNKPKNQILKNTSLNTTQTVGNWIHPSVILGTEVELEQFITIREDSRIGNGTQIFSGVSIGRKVQIGERCKIYPNVTIYDQVTIGDDTIIHAGTVIGSDGFSFVPFRESIVKFPQMGGVEIGSQVEIGANCTIDCGTFKNTVLKDHVKLDNLIQVGHNCEIGEATLLCAFVGLSGSTQIGHHSILAGQVGTKGHMKIGNHVTIAAQSGVSKDVGDHQTVKGYPPRPLKEYLNLEAHFGRLDEYAQRIKTLEKKLAQLNADTEPSKKEI